MKKTGAIWLSAILGIGVGRAQTLAYFQAIPTDQMTFMPDMSRTNVF